MIINWEAVSAIGQILGVIATLIAVIVALKQNKPKIRVEYLVGNEVSFGLDHQGYTSKENCLFITVINIGIIPVTIKNIGLKFPKNSIIINPDPQYGMLPKVLQPSESIIVWTDAKSLENKGIKDFDIAFTNDSTGGTHYCKVKLYRKITRFFYWKFSHYKY